MKKRQYAIQLVVAAGLGCAMAAVGQSAPAALVVADLPVAELQKVVRGAKVRHEFAVRNQGDAEVKLGQPRVTCDCAAVVAPASMAPGQTAAIAVEVDTSELEGPVDVGISFPEGTPAVPELSLVLPLMVKPGVAAKPNAARLLYVQSEPAGGVKAVLSSEDWPNLVIASVEVSSPALRTELKELPAQLVEGVTRRQWELAIEVRPDAPVGPIVGNLVVRTNHPLDKRVTIPTSGFVRPAYSLTPPTAELGTLPKDTRAIFSVIFGSFTTDPIRLTGAFRASIPGTEVEVEPIVPDRKYRIRIKLPRDLPQGALSGSAFLATSSKAFPEVEVRFAGVADGTN